MTQPRTPVVLCAGECRNALHPDQKYIWREVVLLEQAGTKRIARRTYTGRVFCPACVEQAQLTLEVE